jgi:hypothetical protein
MSYFSGISDLVRQSMPGILRRGVRRGTTALVALGLSLMLLGVTELSSTEAATFYAGAARCSQGGNYTVNAPTGITAQTTNVPRNTNLQYQTVYWTAKLQVYTNSGWANTGIELTGRATASPSGIRGIAWVAGGPLWSAVQNPYQSVNPINFYGLSRGWTYRVLNVVEWYGQNVYVATGSLYHLQTLQAVSAACKAF